MAKTVIMQVSIASPDWSYHPKQTVELPDELADAWIACGHAKLGGDIVGKKERKNSDSSTKRATIAKRSQGAS